MNHQTTELPDGAAPEIALEENERIINVFKHNSTAFMRCRAYKLFNISMLSLVGAVLFEGIVVNGMLDIPIDILFRYNIPAFVFILIVGALNCLIQRLMYKKRLFVVTDRRIVIFRGLIDYCCTSVPLESILSIDQCNRI